MASRFMNHPTAKYQQAVAVLRDLIQAEGSDAAKRAFAEAVWVARQALFSKRFGVQPTRSVHVCVHRLLGQRCPGAECDSAYIIPGADHCSEWKKEGRTQMIVSQPYELSYPKLKDTVEFCEKHGLAARVSALDAWYFPGDVIAIEYTRAKASR